jgi:citronellyl-CoA dehydrogenase
VPARQHQRGQAAPEQIADHRADEAAPESSFSPRLDKLGMRSSDTAQIFFDNVRVPQRYRIGHEGAGFVYQMLQFQEERLFAAAGGLKAMEACIDATIEYTRGAQGFRAVHPRQPGRALPSRGVADRGRGAARAHLRRRRGYINGEDVTTKASMAKLKVGRLAREVSDGCLQYWGGMGFMWDNPVARAYRDVAPGTSIGGGADEVMLGIICKQMNILPGKRKPAS